LRPLSVHEDRPVPTDVLAVLKEVDRAASELSQPYMIIGATARDLLLHHVFNMAITRATLDVDFAFAVDNWGNFERLRDFLLATGVFVSDSSPHRLFYKGGTPVDLIPFGPVSENDAIAWPPDGDVIMSVAGFDDAFAAAVRIELTADFAVPVVSLAALAIMKAIAWSERKFSDKDAIDFYRILSTYADAGNVEQLYGSATEFLTDFEYDLELAGAALAGADGKRLSSEATLGKLTDLFFKAGFAEQMAERIRLSLWPFDPDQLARIDRLISVYRQNLLQV